MLVLKLKLLNFQKTLIFKFRKFYFPRLVEILQHLISNLYVFFHLSSLDVLTKIVLVSYNIAF